MQLYADFHGATATEQGWLLSFRNIISFSGQNVFGKSSDKPKLASKKESIFPISVQ